MASPTTMHFTRDDEDEDAREQALREVQYYEGEGRVINDWYSKAEYINRRHGHLGRHPNYEGLPLNQSLTDAADTVFYLAGQLSVQEVRRRELGNEIFPLLPFPTSTNMQSLDDFHSYPDQEWTQDWQPNEHYPLGSPLATLNLPVSHQAGSPPQSQTNSDHLAATAQSHTSSTYPIPSALPPGYPIGQFVSDRAGNFPQSQHFFYPSGQFGSVVPQQTSGAGLLLPSSSFNTLNNNHTTPSQPLAPYTMDPSAVTAGAVYNPLNADNVPQDPADVVKVTYDLKTPAVPLTFADAPQSFQQKRSTPVTSLNGHPVTVSVKVQARGKKRAAPDDEEEAAASPNRDSVEPEADAITQEQEPAAPAQQAESTPPPAKKPKLILKATPPKPADDAPPPAYASSTRSKKTTPTASSSPAKRGTRANTTASSTPKRKTAQRSSTSKAAPAASSSSTTTPAASSSSPAGPLIPTSNDNPQHYTHRRIALGEILPKSIDQANAASKLRKSCFEQDEKNKTNNEKSRPRHHPDFPTEFFDHANFPASDPAASNVVRCLCGARDDNTDRDREWVGCDNAAECGVWQHLDCVGEAAPKDMVKDDYLCHMCDPWKHRKKLQVLRAEEERERVRLEEEEEEKKKKKKKKNASSS